MTALHDSPAPANLDQRARATNSPQRGPLYPANASRPRRAARRARAIAPGFALALAVAAVATVVGQYVPLIGSAVPGAVLGAVIAIVVSVRRQPCYRSGPRETAPTQWLLAWSK